MKYRREIDGLRAVAVVPVVLFHAGFEFFAGGYVGVDVFFVISGYLITSILLREQAAGKFTILNFYERRARRILPALFFVMACCVPLAWLWMAPHQLKDFAQSLVATTLFSSNIFFFLEADYFNESSELSPLLHTWSLAVEEQYYLLFPPLLLVLLKTGKRVTRGVLVGLLVTSLAAAQVGATLSPTANFYLLPSRAWELLIGVFAAFAIAEGWVKTAAINSRLTELLGIVGLLLILVSIFLFDAQTPFPGFWALLPTVGTALIILFGHADSLVGRLLGIRLLVAIGLISYSLYLWHQPLFAFARIRSIADVPVTLYLLLSLLSVGLACFSYWLVERPFRNRAVTSRAAVAAFVSVFALVFPSMGLLGHYKDGFIDYKLSQIDDDLRDLVIDREAEFRARQTLWRRVLRSSSAPFSEATGKTKVLILGDSKSQDLYVAIDQVRPPVDTFEYRRLRLDNDCMLSVSGLDPANLGDAGCRRELTRVLESGLLEAADVIILTNTWTLWTNESVQGFVESLQDSQRPIYILGTANFNDVTSLSLVAARNRLREPALSRFFYANIKPDARMAALDLRDRLSSLQHVTFLDKLELFCDFGQESCQLISEQGEPYIYDSGHVTIAGARLLGQRFLDSGWLSQKEHLHN